MTDLMRTFQEKDKDYEVNKVPGLITWLAATLELPFLLPYMGPLD
jgi:hypothetical protein